MGWSDKYKKSIDCSNPKGFSQRAHCQGKKKKVGESMNFTEYCESLERPLFEADGVPHCPPGYRFDKNKLMCVPKTEKDDVSNMRGSDKKDNSPENMPSFNTIGSHGQNGAPYAYEESRPPNPWGYEPRRPWTKVDDYYSGAKDDYYNGVPEASPFYESTRDYEKEDEDEKRFKKDDARMKYGKDGKPSSLRPGEVRKLNSKGKWVSNKD